tara:strand:+ start:189 stop:464 length:276 start_codon:yes stop_codon:yes gene_type:complete
LSEAGLIEWFGERTAEIIVFAKFSAATALGASPTTTVTPLAWFVVVKTHICMLSSLAKQFAFFSSFAILVCVLVKLCPDHRRKLQSYKNMP